MGGAEFGARVSPLQLRASVLFRSESLKRLATALDELTENGTPSFELKVRAGPATIDKLGALLTAWETQVLHGQGVLRDLSNVLDLFPSPKKGQFNDVTVKGFGRSPTVTKSADNSGKNGGCPASVSFDTSRTSATGQYKQPATAVKRACASSATTSPSSVALEDGDSFKKENSDPIVVGAISWNESQVPPVAAIAPAAEIMGKYLCKDVTLCNYPIGNDPAPEKGPVHDANGIANLVLTVAKGKEQDDDDEDDDDDDDGDDDDYEEEEEDDNDNKLEAGDDEEDVEGEDEEGDEEAGEEDGEDDGEADDNGEGQEDDGEEDGEEEDDVEGDEDGDEDADEEQEDEEEDGEEDPEDEDEDEVEGESEEDIEDLEPPKKKRK